MFVAGDIGGTKTVLALYEGHGTHLRHVHEATYPSREHASLEEILSAFLRDLENPVLTAASFGIAGAVINGAVQTTNLPWRLAETVLAEHLRVPRVKLLNDLEAAALGMLHLAPEEMATLNEGVSRPGHIAVIAAGTGLGEALLYWDGHHYQPMASEGGHCDFAPRSEQEMDLWRHLRGRFGDHVSYERILAGPGLHNVYDFLRDTGFAEEPAWLRDRLAQGDPSAAVAQAGLAKESPLAVEALRLFASIYGAEAGNLALKGLTVGGVYVGGGIAPKLLPALQEGAFMEAFSHKGRFTDKMREIPVRVALNPRAPLLGAAYYALRLARQTH